MKTFLKDCRWGQFILLRGDMISQFMDMYGEWSETEVELYRHLLPSDGICIEVGANIGAHAIPLSKICSEGTIFCFEPQRPLFQILCGNAALNNRLNIVARNQAIGAKKSTLEIESCDYEESWNYGAFSIKDGFSREAKFSGNVTKESIDIVPIDGIPAIQQLKKIDLIKIDAEGLEFEILRGAELTVNRFLPDLFVEANDQSVFDNVLGLVKRWGYNGRWFVSHRFREDNFNRSWFAADGYDINVIFSARRCFMWVACPAPLRR